MRCRHYRQPSLLPLFQAYASREWSDRIGHNRLQIGPRCPLLSRRTAKDHIDEGHFVPVTGLPARGASVVLLFGTKTSRNAHKYVAPPRGDRDERQYSLRRKFDAPLFDLDLAGIYPALSTSNRSPLGKP